MRLPHAGERGPTVSLSGQRLALDPSLARAIGSPCVLGIRPESIEFADAADPEAIPVTIEAETPLNEKIVDLVTTLRGREILVSPPVHMPGPASTSAHILIPTGHALLFDRETGRRILAEGEQRQAGQRQAGQRR